MYSRGATEYCPLGQLHRGDGIASDLQRRVCAGDVASAGAA
jgi:hypothetical protein